MTYSKLKPSVGVLPLDAQLCLVHYTAEAATILEYPRPPRESVGCGAAGHPQLASPPKRPRGRRSSSCPDDAVLKGLSSKEIAVEMSISPNTVKSFLMTVMAKVGASNRTGIIAKILEVAS